MSNNLRAVLLINISLLLAIIVSIIPMPIQFEPFRPDWALLVVMYWSLALPHRVNVGVACIVGFVLDLLIGTVMGVYALAFSVVTFITASNFQKIRNFSVWQQALLIGVFLALYHLLVFWLNYFLVKVYFIPQYLWPALTGVIAWPWLFLVLRKYRRHFRIR